MKIAVTGGSGRLGRTVVTTLRERGHDVVNADLHDTGDGPFIAVDLTRPGDSYQLLTRSRAEAVVHLAALAEPLRHPETKLFACNVTSTFNLFQAAVDLGVETVIYAGSPSSVGYGAPHGWIPQYLPIDEDHPLEPWHAYNLAKAVGEQVLQSFVHRLRAFTVRPCFVVTPDEWAGRAPTQTGITIQERLDRPEIAATSLFNYVDARDVADLIALLIENSGRVPNGEMFYASAPDALARSPLSELIPRYYEGTEQLASGLTGNRPAFSTAKATRLLGWQPTRSWRTAMTP
ncbi:NAD-dependent epimerase/dehydratase family protein [Kribbella sp. NPDC050124]|uniref:NAD-dependent epimerase/dehydratase family protein n=1 Tax=Kribbella sp. NPDC050124 TaxID=3364114 RepID=UPI003789F88F